MKRTLLAVSLLTLAAAPALAQSTSIAIQPGNWENTTNMSITMNMNGQNMSVPAQAQTSTTCITPEDAQLDLSDFTQEGCTVSDLQETSHTVSFRISCNQNGMNLIGDMDLEVSDDGNSTTGSIAMSGTHPQTGTMAMSGTITGQRTGACT